MPDSQGRTFVQRVHEGSATYASEISDKLKELVFDEVMPEIAAGFVAYRREQLGIGEETDESLRQIYRASLSLLYKLLFVLYAEARSLLPIDNPAYWEESLTRMARQFAERIDRGQAISDATHATRQYDALLALFRRIDQGDPSLGIPRYDGGLFNPATPDNQFLAAAQAQRPGRGARRGHPGARRRPAGGLRLHQRAQPGQHLRGAAGE